MSPRVRKVSARTVRLKSVVFGLLQCVLVSGLIVGLIFYFREMNLSDHAAPSERSWIAEHFPLLCTGGLIAAILAWKLEIACFNYSRVADDEFIRGTDGNILSAGDWYSGKPDRRSHQVFRASAVSSAQFGSVSIQYGYRVIDRAAAARWASETGLTPSIVIVSALSEIVDELRLNESELLNEFELRARLGDLCVSMAEEFPFELVISDISRVQKLSAFGES